MLQFHLIIYNRGLATNLYTKVGLMHYQSRHWQADQRIFKNQPQMLLDVMPDMMIWRTAAVLHSFKLPVCMRTIHHETLCFTCFYFFDFSLLFNLFLSFLHLSYHLPLLPLLSSLHSWSAPWPTSHLLLTGTVWHVVVHGSTTMVSRAV